MPLLEGVIAGVLAYSAVETVSKGRETAIKIRRDKRFSDELDPITTEFNDALAERIEAVAQDIESFELQSIAFHWEVIAEKIDPYEAAFEGEEEELPGSWTKSHLSKIST